VPVCGPESVTAVKFDETCCFVSLRLECLGVLMVNPVHRCLRLSSAASNIVVASILYV
jgi:hypothetical protein